MRLIYIRVLFVFISTVIGYQMGVLFLVYDGINPWVGAAGGCGVSLFIILAECFMKSVSLRGMSAAVFGLILGLLMSKLMTDAALLMPMTDQMQFAVRIGGTVIMCYLGMVLALRGRDEFNIVIPYVKFSRQDQSDELAVLDTSVIVDGRIADICNTNFFNGKLIIPRFVLKELQMIADSSDPLKRTRGRRGLDILNKIRKNTMVDVRIHEEDFPDIPEVDSKLVKLARVLDAKVFTNDYNLNKIAELQGVPVLNINELAETLRPVILPGEMMQAKPIKEGKEPSQGVAYLEDGTMVVIDGGKKFIGQNIPVVITSVLQTAAGRMIFGRVQTDAERQAM